MHIDVTLQRAQKSAKNIDVGTKIKLLLAESSLSYSEKLTFRGECLKFYAAETYLQDKLPVKVSLVKNAQYLHPEKKTDVKFANAISNFCLQVSNCLKKVIRNVLTLSQRESVKELFDKVRAQWKKYQYENIPLEYFQKSESVPETVPKPTQNNYWRAAFEAFDLE